MEKKLTILFIILGLSLTSANSKAQKLEKIMKEQQDSIGEIDFKKPEYIKISEDKVIHLIDDLPSFGIYHDNYFITGIPSNKTIDRQTADAKFQVSVRQRLTKTVLPFKTFLALIYTQKSFWDIYEDSAPFGDTNYNPGFVLGKPIISNNKLMGMLALSLEHESNGKDSVLSRSWNYGCLSGTYFFNPYFSAQAKVWYGWLGNENKELFKCRGYGLIALNFRSDNNKIWASAIINPRSKFGDFNTQLELNYKVNSKSNQYIFLQWFNGYGESLLNYKDYSSMVRMGICIKPSMWNLY